MPHLEPVDALVVVDPQVHLIDGASAVPEATETVKAISRLLSDARAAGTAVIFLQNDGTPGSVDAPDEPGWRIDPRLRPAPGEPVLRKDTDDGFAGTSLDPELEHAGVVSLAITGFLSEMCVAATARSALERGYRVVVVRDAHGTYDLEDIPARTVARVAEHALGDGVELVTSNQLSFQ